MNTIIHIGKCLLALAVAFGAWYLADPTYAMLQDEDPTHRIVVYISYVVVVVVTWVCTEPLPELDSRLLP